MSSAITNPVFGAAGGGATGTPPANLAGLKALNITNFSAGTKSETLGYTNAGDNGAGRYELRDSAATADDFLVAQPDTLPSGKEDFRWHLLPNEGGFYNARQGGVVDNDDTAAAWNRVVAVLDAAQSEDVPVYFPGGMEISVLGSSSNYTFTSHCVLFSDIGNLAKFYGDAEEEASPHEFRFNYHATLELYDIWLDNCWNSASSRWAFTGGGGVGSAEKRIVAHRCKFTGILRGGAIGARADENGIVNPDIQDCEVDDIAFGAFNFSGESHRAKIAYNHIKDVIAFRTKGTISEAAVGIQLGDGDNSAFSPTVEYNYIENIRGPVGDRLAIIIEGEEALTKNNLIDGVWGTTDGTDKTTGADIEGIYFKVRRGKIDGNWVFDAAHPGSVDGAITIKGTEPDSRLTTMSNNLVWNFDNGGVYDINTSSAAGRNIGSANITGNILMGRWTFTDVPSETGLAYQNVSSGWSNNLLWKGLLQIGASTGPGWTSITIGDSVFVSREKTDEGCIEGSGDVPQTVNISNIVCFTDGYVLNNVGASKSFNAKGSVFYSSGNNAPFRIDASSQGVLTFSDNISLMENPLQSVTTPSFSLSGDRFRAGNEVIVENNYFELPPSQSKWRTDPEGRYFYFRKNIVRSNRDVPSSFGFLLANAGSGGVAVVVFSVTDNRFSRIRNTDSEGMLELIGTTYPRLHRFEWLRNEINRTENLFRASEMRIGIVRVEDNDFAEDLARINAMSGGALSQTHFGGFARIEVNRNPGWKTEDWVNGSVEPGQTIAHNMRHAPNFALLTVTGADGVSGFRVSNKGASSITVEHGVAGELREFDAYVAYKYAYPAQLAAPSLVSPTDSETDVAVDTSFKWENLDGSTIHHLQISTTNAESGLIYDNNEVWGLWVDTDDANVETDGSSSFRDNLPIPALDNNTPYWYRVRSAAGRWGTWSAWRSFTTIA